MVIVGVALGLHLGGPAPVTPVLQRVWDRRAGMEGEFWWINSYI